MTGCYGCEYLIDTFGNYVECGLLAKTGSHLFVDWWYWNAGCPDNCPKKGKEKGDIQQDREVKINGRISRSSTPLEADV
jgi:hypothetical protein